MTSVLLVQRPDAAGVRLRTSLISAPSVLVVKEVADVSEAVDVLGHFRSDVVVLRVETGDVTESGVLGELRDVAPWARIVLHAHSPPSSPGRAHWTRRLVGVVAEHANPPTLEARLELPDDLRSVSLARSLLTQLLDERGTEDLVDVATLLITELLANAIRHVPGACAVELTRHEDTLRIAAIDTGPGMPDRQGLSLGGLGMHIVAALSTDWGVDRLEDGCKAVWAEVRTMPR